MTSRPLISIVTITFNAAATLPATMKSVAEQTFTDYEHILIDGASSDGTLGIARSNPYMRILSEKDNGLYDAMNKGLRLARGKYVLFLNSGDTFRTPEVLARYAERAADDYDIIYSDTMVVDAEGNDIKPRHHSVPERLTFESFSKGMLVCHQAFMVKAAIAPQYDLSYRFSADYDWTIKCIKKTSPDRCCNLKIVGINYLADGTTDHNKVKSLLERYRIMSRHYGKLSTFAHHVRLVLGLR